MPDEVAFAPEALTDLIRLYDYIADNSGEARALTFVEAVRKHCLSLVTFLLRGTLRDDLRPGLRTLGFARRLTIAFHITPERIIINRILYAGRDLSGLIESRD